MTVSRVQFPVISALILMAVPAAAMPIETDSDIRLNWDNTFQATMIEQPGTQNYGPAGRCLPARGDDAMEAASFPCTPRSGLVSGRLEWQSPRRDRGRRSRRRGEARGTRPSQMHRRLR